MTPLYKIFILVRFIITVTIHGRNNLREERFILAQSFRGFHPWLLGPMSMVTGACGRGGSLPHGRQEADTEIQDRARARYSPKEIAPVTTSPARPHFLKFLPPPKIVPPASTHEPAGAISYLNHNSLI
jgi:hypothetical protein